MLLQPVWDWLAGEVFSLPVEAGGSSPLFNPYLGTTPGVDRPCADLIRQENLRRYLESFSLWPDTLVIGEAPGWRGGRFSGVPFTSEAQLTGGLPFRGSLSSRSTLPHSEATATIFWQVMLAYHPRFLAWNSLPFHPHLPGQPLTNRKPTLGEICLGGELLRRLVTLLSPRRVIAVGICAQVALRRLGLPADPLRHPGHGGSKAFKAGMQSILGIPSHPSTPPGSSQIPAGRKIGADPSIGYNSGTILAPREDHILPL